MSAHCWHRTDTNTHAPDGKGQFQARVCCHCGARQHTVLTAPAGGHGQFFPRESLGYTWPRETECVRPAQ